MVETKLSGPSMEQRIQNRLRNSGEGAGTTPDVTVKTGNSPLRTFHNIHNAAGNQARGEGEKK